MANRVITISREFGSLAFRAMTQNSFRKSQTKAAIQQNLFSRREKILLGDKADCLNVFIHASMEKRAERIVREYGESVKTPEQRIREKDKRRAAYHRFYTDMKWGHAQNYHVCLDSGELGIDKCVNIIVSLY